MLGYRFESIEFVPSRCVGKGPIVVGGGMVKDLPAIY